MFLVLEVLNHVSSEKKLEKLAEFIESAVTKIMKASIKDSGRYRHSPGHDCSRKGQNIGKPYLKKFSGDTGCGETWAGGR